MQSKAGAGLTAISYGRMGAWAGFDLKFTSRGPAPPRPLSQPSCPRTALPSPLPSLLTHCDRPRVTCRASPLPLLLSDSSSPDLPGLADRQQEGRGERTRGPHGKEEKGGNGARTAGATPSARAVTQDEGERGNGGQREEGNVGPGPGREEKMQSGGKD